MKIIYAKNYKPFHTLYRIWHHSGGTSINPYISKENETAESIEVAHKFKFKFPSKYMVDSNGRPRYGGYNFIINRDGSWIQSRAIGEETAANRYWNYNGIAISICIIGNFNKNLFGRMIDRPTHQQILTIRFLDSQLPKALNKSHRFLSPTIGYGSGLSDDWIKDTLNSPPKPDLTDLQRVINAIRRMIAELQFRFSKLKLGGRLPDCQETNSRG